MRITKILCDWCEADLTDEKGFIVIDGKIHYCAEVCKELEQKRCFEETNHKNSVKDRSEGHCLDCGITYADPNL